MNIAYGNNNNINDYIAISSDSSDPFGQGAQPLIGVARNRDSGTPRCFTYPNSSCTAPAGGSILGVPYYIRALPVVSAATELAAENSDGSPSGPISGVLITTPEAASQYGPANYWSHGLNTFGPNCSQTRQSNFLSQGQVVFVRQMNFGGTVGVRDALVSDGFAIGPPNHVERYYYVAGLGDASRDNSRAFFKPAFDAVP